MANNYFRLLTFFSIICADVFRNLLLHFAQADSQGHQLPFTNLVSYLHNRKSDIMQMRNIGRLTRHQFNRIFTCQSKADIQSWDISILTSLINTLFHSRLDIKGKAMIKKIRAIRNELVHISHVDTITDVQFNVYWDELQEATLYLTSYFQGKKYEEVIKEKIDHLKKDIKHEYFDTFRGWFEEKVTQSKDEFEQELERMKYGMDYMRKNISLIEYKVDEYNNDNDDDETNDQQTASKRVSTGTLEEPSSSQFQGFETSSKKRKSVYMHEMKVDEVDDDADDEELKDHHDASKRSSTGTLKEPSSSDILGINTSSKRRKTICLPETEGAFVSKTVMDEDPLKGYGSVLKLKADESDRGTAEKDVVKARGSCNLYCSDQLNLKRPWENIKTVDDAHAVINNGLLPNERELSDVVQRLGRKSDTVGLLCQSICKKIESASPNYIHVFAAYSLSNKNKLHFVVLFENESSSDLKLDHEILFRNCRGDGKTEKKEIEIELLPEESTSLKNAVQTISKKYMEKHKYLSAITARKISIEEREILCIVMYVHPCTNKYFDIPHNEDHLPATIKGYKVVVRNGVYKTAIKTASEKHDNVRMGCQITSNLITGIGTLGGFVEHPAYGLCGFTCAHVIFGSKEMKKVKKKKRVERYLTKNPCFVYQPSTEFNPIGRVVEAFYTEGGGDSDSAGVDLALFQLEQRPPVEGTFPQCNMNEEWKYVSGKTWGKSRLKPGCDVNKYGAVTGATRGKVMFDGMCVQDLNFVAKGAIAGVDATLYNQYEIENDTVNVCEQGDSGALVFVEDSIGELICIGMVNGVLDEVNPLHGVVTPITDLLQKMKAMNLKHFRQQLTVDLFEKKFSENAEKARVQQQAANSDLLSQIQGEFNKIPPFINDRVTEMGNDMFKNVIEGVQTTIKSQLESAMTSMQTYLDERLTQIMANVQKEKEIPAHNHIKETERNNCGGT